jgi:hypothetical protein
MEISSPIVTNIDNPNDHDGRGGSKGDDFVIVFLATPPYRYNIFATLTS